MYRMTTIYNGTKIREDHNINSNTLAYVNANVQVEGTELFTAPVQLSSVALGVYQNVNDKWLKISYNGVTGWMAYLHKGGAICKDFKEVVDEVPPVVQIPDELEIPINGEVIRYVRAS